MKQNASPVVCRKQSPGKGEGGGGGETEGGLGGEELHQPNELS